jgi:hypothetical protein
MGVRWWRRGLVWEKSGAPYVVGSRTVDDWCYYTISCTEHYYRLHSWWLRLLYYPLHWTILSPPQLMTDVTILSPTLNNTIACTADDWCYYTIPCTEQYYRLHSWWLMLLYYPLHWTILSHAQLMTDVTKLSPALNNTIACTRCVVVNAARSIVHSSIPMRGIFSYNFFITTFICILYKQYNGQLNHFAYHWWFS